MKVITTVFLALALVAVPVGFAAESVEKVTGAGVQIVDDNGGVRTLAFSVRQASDGSVRGQAQVVRYDTDVVAHYTIDCLRVDTTADGYPRATMSGTLTSSSSNPELVGRPIWFQVVDQAPDKTDMATPSVIFVTSDGVTCSEDFEAGFIHLYPVTQGNVVIH